MVSTKSTVPFRGTKEQEEALLAVIRHRRAEKKTV